MGDLGSATGWEDPLEEGMTIHSSILAWRIPLDRGAWWAAVHRAAKRHSTGTDEVVDQALNDQQSRK